MYTFHYVILILNYTFQINGRYWKSEAKIHEGKENLWREGMMDNSYDMIHEEFVQAETLENDLSNYCGENERYKFNETTKIRDNQLLNI